jgi:hypothetical protein
LLEKNIDKIDWRELSGNLNSIHLLEQLLAESKVLEGKALLFLELYCNIAPIKFIDIQEGKPKIEEIIYY